MVKARAIVTWLASPFELDPQDKELRENRMIRIVRLRFINESTADLFRDTLVKKSCHLWNTEMIEFFQVH